MQSPGGIGALGSKDRAVRRELGRAAGAVLGPVSARRSRRHLVRPRYPIGLMPLRQ
jgi:hypothetical protein